MQALLDSAKALGGALEPDAFLADECVSLVEEPFVVPGQFDEAFLDLPDEVVIAVGNVATPGERGEHQVESGRFENCVMVEEGDECPVGRSEAVVARSDCATTFHTTDERDPVTSCVGINRRG